MDDISREHRSGSLPEQGGSIAAKGPQERADGAEPSLGDRAIVDESVLDRGVTLAEPAIPVVEVPRVIVEPGSGEPAGQEPLGHEPLGHEPSDEHRPDETVAGGADDSASTDDEPVAPGLESAAADHSPADGEDEAPALSDLDEIARVSFGLLLTQRDGISPLRLADVCGTTQQNVRGALERLAEILQQDGLPLEVSRTGDRVKLLTRPEIYPYVERLKGIKRRSQLSPAALETLAVIAYRQPVIRAEIESIRGVKAGPMLRSLLEHKLVKVVGRADVPGRPLQYGTTQDFLERFGLESLKELPSVQEFKGL